MLQSMHQKNIKNCSSVIKDDLTMQWLIEELKYSAKQGDILELSKVWNRYFKLTEQVGSEVPHCFVNRRSSFKKRIQAQLDT